MQGCIEVNLITYRTWRLETPPGDLEEEIIAIILKIKFIVCPEQFIYHKVHIYLGMVHESCKFYGLQVKERFENLKKRRTPGSFTEQGKELKGGRKKLHIYSLSLSLLDTFIRGLSNWLVVDALVVESSCLSLSLRS
jgi:hypothetical protein